MSKKVIIISSSPRKNGNSYTLAAEFEKGAASVGNITEKINIRELDLKFCIGCQYCQSHGVCVQKDSMNGIYEKIENADVIVFATPVYYYAVSGQLKTFLDRLNPLYPRNNKFKDVYLLASAADEIEHTFDGAVKDINGWIECFEGVRLAGTVFAYGVNGVKDIQGRKELQEAYDMGRSV